jgi:hypothetical protein
VTEREEHRFDLVQIAHAKYLALLAIISNYANQRPTSENVLHGVSFPDADHA